MFHSVDRFTGVGRSYIDLFTIFISGLDFRVGFCITQKVRLC